MQTDFSDQFINSIAWVVQWVWNMWEKKDFTSEGKDSVKKFVFFFFMLRGSFLLIFLWSFHDYMLLCIDSCGGVIL